MLHTMDACVWSWASQAQDNDPAFNPLVRVLQAKGILTEEEAGRVSQASSASDDDGRLARLLLMKGVISRADYDLTVGAPGMMNASSTGASGGGVVAAVYRVPVSNGSNSGARSSGLVDQGAASAPAVVPAVAPLRVLPIDVPKQGGLIPDIKLGRDRKSTRLNSSDQIISYAVFCLKKKKKKQTTK